MIFSINLNYVPDGNLADFAANGECLPINNQNFGKLNPLTTRYADNVLHGFGVRGFLWDITTEVQHELFPGASVTGGYYRSRYGNFLATFR